MIKKFNKLDNNKKIPIVIVFSTILITLLIVFTFFGNKGYNYDSLKEDKDKDFVYTINSIKEDVFFINIPYINISGSSIKSINEEIDSYINEFTNKKMINSSYEYRINGKVLSLVIKTVDYYSEDTPVVYFKTYNINLDTLGLVSNEELLNAYEISSSDVNNTIEKQFEYWYKDEIKKGFLEKNECDYECFLEYRGGEDYMDNISYYIDNGKLVVFKPFEVYSIFGEEDYFSEQDFKFTIK